AFRAPGLAAGATGRTTVNVLPLPTTLSTVMSPPIIRAKRRARASPSPAPSPPSRADPSCWNTSQIDSLYSAALSRPAARTPIPREGSRGEHDLAALDEFLGVGEEVLDDPPELRRFAGDRRKVVRHVARESDGARPHEKREPLPELAQEGGEEERVVPCRGRTG